MRAGPRVITRKPFLKRFAVLCGPQRRASGDIGMAGRKKLGPISEPEFDNLLQALSATTKGRSFLDEYRRRCQPAETLGLLESLSQIEATLGDGARSAAAGADRRRAAAHLHDARHRDRRRRRRSRTATRRRAALRSPIAPGASSRRWRTDSWPASSCPTPAEAGCGAPRASGRAVGADSIGKHLVADIAA